MSDARMNGRYSSSISSGVDIPDNFEHNEDEENVVLGAGQVRKSVANMFHSSTLWKKGLVVLGVILCLLLLSGVGGIVSYNKKVETMKQMKSLEVSLSDPKDCQEQDSQSTRHLESLTWGKKGEIEAVETPLLHLRMKARTNSDRNERHLVSSTPNETERLFSQTPRQETKSSFILFQCIF